LSPQGRQAIAPASGHVVQNDAPEIVAQAIRDMAGRVRGR
jgi:hypothetical protein